MTPEEKFLFDLNGFLVVRGAVDQATVARMQAAAESKSAQVQARAAADLKNAVVDSQFGGSAGGSRLDLGGVLGWDEPAFREMLAHPKLVPYLNELCGPGYRCDHQPLVIESEQGAEGFSLHGGPISGDGGAPEACPSHVLQYWCRNGRFFNSLLAMSVCLNKTEKGDGGFCVIRGSHKMNFPIPRPFAAGTNREDPLSAASEFSAEHVYQPATEPGDVIFFSEATVHGALPWRGEGRRRLCLYRFAPPNLAYGRSYLPQGGAFAAMHTETGVHGEGGGAAPFGIPAHIWESMPRAQACVLAGPFANRVERAELRVAADGTVEVSVKERNPTKKEHDSRVFGTPWF